MNDIYLYIGIILVALCWVITPFLKRSLGKNLTSVDIFINTQIIILTYGILTLMILKYLKYDFDLLSIKNLDKNQMLTLLASSLTTYMSSITLIWLVKHYEVTQIIPQIQPIVMVLTILSGIFIFSEKVTKTELLGLSLIISGVYIINKFRSA
tara:strand:+ start:3516 stop:3974 length:459 start_codon:yes stop_codon:yes gene_type:complete